MPSLEIANRMIQVVPAITGLLDRLQAQELIKRNRCTEDRRVVYIEITAKALKLLKEIDKPDLDLHHKLIGHLSSSEPLLNSLPFSSSLKPDLLQRLQRHLSSALGPNAIKVSLLKVNRDSISLSL